MQNQLFINQLFKIFMFMKKLMLLFILSFCVISLNAQYKTFRKGVFVKFKSYENAEGKLQTVIDSLGFKFTPNTENLWGIEITNKSNTKISVVWDKSVFGAGDRLSKVIFGTDSRLTMPMPKSDDIIYPNAYISREIDNVKNYEDANYISKLFVIKYLKDGYEWPVKLIIPIKKGQLEKDYVFEFLVYKL